MKSETDETNERTNMNSQFDELTRSLAKSVTRRAALKKFGVGLAGLALACFGLANKSAAQTGCLPRGYTCKNNSDCCSGYCNSGSHSPGHLKFKACL